MVSGAGRQRTCERTRSHQRRSLTRLSSPCYRQRASNSLSDRSSPEVDQRPVGHRVLLRASDYTRTRATNSKSAFLARLVSPPSLSLVPAPLLAVQTRHEMGILTLNPLLFPKLVSRKLGCNPPKGKARLASTLETGRHPLPSLSPSFPQWNGKGGKHTSSLDKISDGSGPESGDPGWIRVSLKRNEGERESGRQEESASSPSEQTSGSLRLDD